MLLGGDAQAALDRLLKQPPLKVDCQELMQELKALEMRAPDATSVLQQGLAKYEYAERAQHAARVRKLSDEVDALLVEPLDVDVVELAAALESLAALAKTSSPALQRGEAGLNAARVAQAEALERRRRAAADELERCASMGLLLLRVEELEHAIAAGEEAHVEPRLVAYARERLVAAARRSRAAANLEYIETAGAHGLADDGTTILAAIHEVGGVRARGVARAWRGVRVASACRVTGRSA